MVEIIITFKLSPLTFTIFFIKVVFSGKIFEIIFHKGLIKLILSERLSIIYEILEYRINIIVIITN